jgi:hypothetical protein
MKQLITLAAICFLLAAASSANPILNDTKPARHHTNNDDGKREIQVSPNPKTGNALVSFKAEKAGNAVIVVLNESGATVIKQQVKLAEGKNKIDISNFTSLQEGYYTVCLNTNYKTYSAPFLLWK